MFLISVRQRMRLPFHSLLREVHALLIAAARRHREHNPKRPNSSING